MQLEDKLCEQVELIINKRLADNSLVIPPPPAAVVKCLALTRQPNFSLKDAAPIIETDPILAARILRAANSAAFGGASTVRNIAQALTRLGLTHLRTLLIEAAAARLFESRDTRIAEACRGVWEHSISVACLARDVAALAGLEDTETAYMVGLLHDVGKPVVAWVLLEAERSVVGPRTNVWIDSKTWVEVLQRCHRKVGVNVANKWGLPEATAKAISDCGDYDSGDRLSPGNCVRFANALAKQVGLYVGHVDPTENDALVMIGRSLLNLDEEVLKRLCSGLADRVRSKLAS